ncbi:MAG: peptidylprolyl isomerase [Cyclobacteriaceae bacterium]
MKRVLLAGLVLIGLLTACESDKDYVVIIHTEYGDMKAILYDETPLHKKNFIELAKAGKYDSTIWHRVIKGFMIQGGDVNAKEGTREAEADRITAEIVDGFMHTKGALAAARQPDQVNPEKQSSSTQFYIVHGKVFSKDELVMDQSKVGKAIRTLFDMPEYDSLLQEYIGYQRARDTDAMNALITRCKPLMEEVTGEKLDKDIAPERLEAYTTIGGAPHLDTDYSVFGRVVEGLDIIDKIAAVKTARGDKPLKDTYMTMEVEMVKKKEITKLYGYEYPKAEK